MNQVVQNLLKLLETGTTDIRISCLEDICDYLEHPYPDEDGYVDTVQQLIVLFSKENDPVIRKKFVRAIERAYMYRIDLTGISFEPLISGLSKGDSVFIRSVLYLLSLTYNRKYIPVIEEYLAHPVEDVRTEATYILDTW
jgi:hypothetical protein